MEAGVEGIKIGDTYHYVGQAGPQQAVTILKHLDNDTYEVLMTIHKELSKITLDELQNYEKAGDISLDQEAIDAVYDLVKKGITGLHKDGQTTEQQQSEQKQWNDVFSGNRSRQND